MKNVPILIIEDDRWLAEQYERVLKLAGYKTTVSQHASGAIDIIDDFHPKAIILDVLLTGATAFILLHELQSYSDTSKIPVILCTNLAAELSIDDLKPYGVCKIIDKTTMAPDDLNVAIKSLLL
jgi:DNA-binding response OmpR family regulator